MKLSSLEYKEYLDTPREWQIKKFNFKNINLIVGINAVGKSRLLNVIKNLAEYTYNPSKKPYGSACWNIVLRNKEKIQYELECKDSKVFHELLKIKNEVVLKRNKEGKGEIKAVKLKENLEFQISEDILAISAKRDQLQHGFLEKLFGWGNNLIFIPFGTPMGQNDLIPLEIKDGISIVNIRSGKDYINEFYNGAKKYGHKFIKSIIEDMQRLDYDIKEIKLKQVQFQGLFPAESTKFFNLQITEEEIGILVEQLNLSQGMFRAISTIIKLNYLIFEDLKNVCVLIDDIGEGLDYNRSVNLVKLLIDKLKNTEIQLIMTTNDRFVMNNIPIEYWSILNRKGHIVEVINYENSQAIFNDFYKTGLSNFDFFSSKLYLGEEKNN